MSNDFYIKSGTPATNSAGSSSEMRSEFASVEAGFDKLPTVTGNPDKPVFVNTAGTAMESITAASARTKLGVAIGTDVQAYDADLAALAALASAADKIPYFTGASTAALADFTAAARTLLAAATAALQRAALGSTAVGDAVFVASNAAAARTAIGAVIGTDVQAQDAELAAIAGLTSAADRLPYFTGSGTASLATFTAARALLDDADAAAMLVTLGAPSLSVANTWTAAQTFLDASLSVAKLQMVRALVYSSAPGNAGGAIPFDTEVYDTGGIHDNATNNSRLTVPAGYTLAKVSGNVSFRDYSATPNNDRSVYITKNGLTFNGMPWHTQMHNSTVSGSTSINVSSAFLEVTAGDYFELKTIENDTLTVNVENDERTWFAIELWK